jgi:hypothetical protein
MAAWLSLFAGHGDAAALSDASWWWFGNQGPAPAPAPPNVPDGGLYVAGAPDSAKALAALRFTLEEGESNPVLTLAVAPNGDQGGDNAVLGACVAGSSWGGGEKGGPWDAKPNAACATGSVQGIRAADGLSWTFALAPLVVAGEVNVVLTPGNVAGSPVGSTFSLAFNPPTTASLATTPGSSSSSSFDSGAAASDLSTDQTFGDASSLAGLDLGATSGDLAPFQPSLPAASQGLTPTAPVVRQATAGNVVPRPVTSGRGSAIAFFVLVAGIAAMVRLNRVPTPLLRRLGPLASSSHAAPTVAVARVPARGGLGRFPRRRAGAPPPLV